MAHNTLTTFCENCDQPPLCTHALAHVVMRAGHGVGPRVRFLAGSGEWIWIQAEVHLRYKGGTNTPQYWEIKIRSLRWVYM